MGNCNGSSNLLEYRRTALTKKPAYEIYVGNLDRVVKAIEESIETHSKNTGQYKENKPFITLISPPRHGKSLTLDTLFTDSKFSNFLVVSITYNHITNISASELTTWEMAVDYFWLRAFKSLTRSDETLESLYNMYNYKPWSLSRVISKVRKRMVNPFEDDVGSKRNIIICVDEFSLLTDMAKETWTSQECQSFIGRIRDTIRNSNPIVQFVFTGFHSTMTDMMLSSSVIEHHVLEQCSFSLSKPLLEIIRGVYVQNNAQFPMLLFESVKSTPGLVGLWAERACDGNLDSQLSTFQQQTAWLIQITNNDCYKDNYNAVVSFMRILERTLEAGGRDVSADIDAAGAPLVEKQIGVGGCKGRFPEIIPLCFVLIIKTMFNRSGSNPLLESLNSALKYCEMVDDKYKNGIHFENFVYHALRSRFYLRQCNVTESSVSMTTHQLLPGLAYWATTTCCDMELKFQLHLLNSKDQLKQFLLPPLYYLFPLGLSALSSDSTACSGSKSKMTDWAQNNTQRFQLAEVTEFPRISLALPGEKSERCNWVIDCSRTGITEIELNSFYCFVKLNTSKTNDPSFLDDYCDSVSGTIAVGQEQKETSYAQKKPLEKFWNQVKLISKTLTEGYRSRSLFVTPKSAEGVDLILVWTQERDTSECTFPDDSVAVAEKSVVHIGAVELKDRQNTSAEEWDRKIAALTSLRCGIWWLPLLVPSTSFEYHIVFAGREH